jgi:hypothetical protein
MMIYDLVVGQTVNDNLALSLNADYWKNGDPHWWGVGIKAKVGLHENFYLAPRFEYIGSKNGGYGGDAGLATTSPLTMGDAAIYEFTVTGVVPVKKNYEVRAEFRGDFTDKDGTFFKGTENKKNQFTALLGFLAWLP